MRTHIRFSICAIWLALLLAPLALAHTIDGVVTSLADVAVADARVTLRDEHRSTVDWTVTGSDGAYRLSRVPDGTFEMTVVKEGFHDYSEQFELVGYSTHEIHRDISLLPMSSTLGPDKALSTYYLPKGTKVNKKAVKLITKGEKLERQGDLPGALALYQQSVQLAPEFARPYNSVGKVSEKLGLKDQALAALRKACELNPQDPVPRVSLGGFLNRAGQSAEALPLLQEALQLDGTSAEGQLNLGTAFYSLEQYADARAPLQMAISLNPAESAPAWSLLGEVQLKLGDLREALRAFRKSLEADPNQPQATDVREKIRKLEEMATRPIGG